MYRYTRKGDGMTKMLSLIALTGLLGLSSTPVLAQTADEIVEKHLAASGGREALGKLRSRVVSGTISISTPIGDLPGSLEVFAKAPNKQRTLVKLDLTTLGAGQIVVDQRFDGTVGYVIDTFNGNRDVTGSQLDALRNSTFPSPLLNYRDSGWTLELIGKEKAGDRDSYALRVVPKAGPPLKMLVDSETFMLLQQVITVNVPELGGDVEQVSELSDYRDVDGVKVPYTFKSTNIAQTITAKLADVKHNVEIDDSSFSKP